MINMKKIFEAIPFFIGLIFWIGVGSCAVWGVVVLLLAWNYLLLKAIAYFLVLFIMIAIPLAFVPRGFFR